MARRFIGACSRVSLSELSYLAKHVPDENPSHPVRPSLDMGDLAQVVRKLLLLEDHGKDELRAAMRLALER